MNATEANKELEKLNEYINEAWSAYKEADKVRIERIQEIKRTCTHADEGGNTKIKNHPDGLYDYCSGCFTIM